MIFDTDGDRLTAYTISMEESTQTIASLEIDCDDGYRLWSSTSSGVGVEARKLGDTVWVNLLSTDIHLTPYAPSRQTFQVRLTAPSVSRFERDTVLINVSK